MFFSFVMICFSDPFQQNIRIFKSLNDFHYVIYFFCFKLLTFLNSLLELFLFYFSTAVFSCFSCLSNNSTFTLMYSTIYTNYRSFAALLQNSKKFSLDYLIIVFSLVFVLLSPPAISGNTISWIALGSVSKAFCLLKSTAIIL